VTHLGFNSFTVFNDSQHQKGLKCVKSIESGRG